MFRRTRTSIAALAIVSLATLGACSDDGDDASPDTTAAAEAEAPEVEAGEPVDCGDDAGETVTVEIPEFEFAPDPVQVSACDQIVWSNTHDQPHTATGNATFSWSTDTIAAGAESEPTVFDTPGEHVYMCALHPFMTGTVEVA